MTAEKLSVSIDLSADDIKLLAQELNDTESSELGILIEEILKKTDEAAEKIGATANRIKSVNPFSQKHIQELQTVS